MQATDIIRQSMEKEGLGEKVNGFLNNLAAGIKEKSIGLLQENDTVLLFRGSGDKTVEFHILTADAPPQMKDALAKFYQHFKSAGIEYAESSTKTPAMIRIAQQAGIPIQAHKIGDHYKIEIEVQ